MNKNQLKGAALLTAIVSVFVIISGIVMYMLLTIATSLTPPPTATKTKTLTNEWEYKFIPINLDAIGTEMKTKVTKMVVQENKTVTPEQVVKMRDTLIESQLREVNKSQWEYTGYCYEFKSSPGAMLLFKRRIQ